MKVRRIEALYVDPKAPVETFGSKEFITRKDIEIIADELAKQIKGDIALLRCNIDSEEAMTIILNVLDRDIFFSRLNKYSNFNVGKDKSDDGMSWQISRKDKPEESAVIVTEEEVEMALQPIRRAVLERLRDILGDDTVHLISEAINRDIFVLDDSKILKKKTLHRFQNPQERSNKNTAISHLYRLTKRSPNILYHFLEIDDKNETSSMEISDRIPFQTLEEFLAVRPRVVNGKILSTEEIAKIERDRAGKSMEILMEGIRGAVFLVENGLVLMDLDPSNIVIDKEDGVGKLFDFDGLRIKGAPTNYIAKLGRHPPESYFSNNYGANESHMVYELGRTLNEILIRYTRYLNDLGRSSIDTIIKNTTDLLPSKRPSLKVFAERLEKVLLEIEEN